MTRMTARRTRNSASRRFPDFFAGARKSPSISSLNHVLASLMTRTTAQMTRMTTRRTRSAAGTGGKTNCAGSVCIGPLRIAIRLSRSWLSKSVDAFGQDIKSTSPTHASSRTRQITTYFLRRSTRSCRYIGRPTDAGEVPSATTHRSHWPAHQDGGGRRETGTVDGGAIGGLSCDVPVACALCPRLAGERVIEGMASSKRPSKAGYARRIDWGLPATRRNLRELPVAPDATD
jgi:hypothetical protein